MPRKTTDQRAKDTATRKLMRGGRHRQGRARAAAAGCPDARPTTTEPVSTTPVLQSYGSIQDSARGAGVEEWRQIDKLRADLSATYQSLREDPRYSEQYKACLYPCNLRGLA